MNPSERKKEKAKREIKPMQGLPEYPGRQPQENDPKVLVQIKFWEQGLAAHSLISVVQICPPKPGGQPQLSPVALQLPTPFEIHVPPFWQGFTRHWPASEDEKGEKDENDEEAEGGKGEVDERNEEGELTSQQLELRRIDRAIVPLLGIAVLKGPISIGIMRRKRGLKRGRRGLILGEIAPRKPSSNLPSLRIINHCGQIIAITCPPLEAPDGGARGRRIAQLEIQLPRVSVIQIKEKAHEEASIGIGGDRGDWNPADPDLEVGKARNPVGEDSVDWAVERVEHRG